MSKLIKCDACDKLRDTRHNKELFRLNKKAYNYCNIGLSSYYYFSCFPKVCPLCLENKETKRLALTEFINGISFPRPYGIDQYRINKGTIVKNLQNNKVSSARNLIIYRTQKKLNVTLSYDPNKLTYDHDTICCMSCAEEICHAVGLLFSHDKLFSKTEDWKVVIPTQLHSLDQSVTRLRSTDLSTSYFCPQEDVPYDSMNERFRYIQWLKIAHSLNGPHLQSSTLEARNFKPTTHYEDLL